MQKRYADGVDPEGNYSLSASKAEELSPVLVIFIQHLVSSKTGFWTPQYKHLLFGESWEEGFLIAPRQPLSSCLPAFTELYESLLRKAKAARSSAGLIRVKGVLIESILGRSNIHLKSRQFTCFSFPFNFPKYLHIHSSIRSFWVL